MLREFLAGRAAELQRFAEDAAAIREILPELRETIRLAQSSEQRAVAAIKVLEERDQFEREDATERERRIVESSERSLANLHAAWESRFHAERQEHLAKEEAMMGELRKFKSFGVSEFRQAADSAKEFGNASTREGERNAALINDVVKKASLAIWTIFAVAVSVLLAVGILSWHRWGG